MALQVGSVDFTPRHRVKGAHGWPGEDGVGQASPRPRCSRSSDQKPQLEASCGAPASFWPGASFTSSGQNAHRPNEYGSTQALRVSYGAVDKQPPKQFWRNQHTKGPVSGAAAVRKKRRE